MNTILFAPKRPKHDFGPRLNFPYPMWCAAAHRQLHDRLISYVDLPISNYISSISIHPILLWIILYNLSACEQVFSREANFLLINTIKAVWNIWKEWLLITKENELLVRNFTGFHKLSFTHKEKKKKHQSSRMNGHRKHQRYSLKTLSKIIIKVSLSNFKSQRLKIDLIETKG